jgi:hypothetical protein
MYRKLVKLNTTSHAKHNFKKINKILLSFFIFLFFLFYVFTIYKIFIYKKIRKNLITIKSD